VVAKPLTTEVVARAHAPSGALVRWMKALLAEYVAGRHGSRKVAELEAEIAGTRTKLERARTAAQRWQSLADADAIIPADTVCGKVADAGLPAILGQLDVDILSKPSVALPSPRVGTPTSRPGTRLCRPITSLEVAPPEQAPPKSCWSDAVDIRPKRAELGLARTSGLGSRLAAQSLLNAGSGRTATMSPSGAPPRIPRCVSLPTARVELQEDAPPSAFERAIAQLRLPFRKGVSEICEQDPEQAGVLRRLVTLMKVHSQVEWSPKVRLEGRREAEEVDGTDAERALAVYRWLVDRGHAEPGALRLRASTVSRVERCVVFRPISSIIAFSGPAQQELSSASALPPGIFFDVSEAVLTTATMSIIEEMSRWLRTEEHSTANVNVEGHADSHEKDLSLARARAVSDALAFHGVCAKRMRVQACRAWHPVSRTTMGLNRRVEVHLC